jgi:membrane-associated phospholipid phosphatase
MDSLIQTFTRLGDSALLLPLGLVLALLVGTLQSRRAGLWLLGCFALCVGTTALVKLAFMTCAPLWGSDIVSPSGHASMSTAVYGALGLVAARQCAGWRQPAFLLGSLGLAALIALTRVPVGAHSLAEVAVGLAIGSMAWALFAFHYLRRPQPRLRLVLLLLPPLAALVLMQALDLHAEQRLRAASTQFERWSHLCV